MEIRWDLDDNTVIDLRVGGFRKNRLTINENEIPVDLTLRGKNGYSFQLPDGRAATISVEPQFATRPLVELRIDGNLIAPTGKKPTLCAGCGTAVKPNDKFCSACGHEMPPAEHYVHKRYVKEATGAITLLAVLFAISGPLMYYLTQLQSQPLMEKLAGMDPDDTYPEKIGGDIYTVSSLKAQLEWEPWSALIVNLILAAIMAGLALWGRRAPLPAVLIAAATYAVVIVLNAIIEPMSLAQGILMKVLIIVFLVRGIKAALALRAANG
jgi:predicted nucleic acid-binding Zn ribbon protein